MSINKVILVGNLGADPEIRTTSQGNPVANISVATTYKPKQGEPKTAWHRAVLWGQQAKFAEQYLRKGAEVYIEGRIEYREYDKDGHKHVSAEIIAYDVQGLGKRDRPATGNTEAPRDYPEKNGNVAGGVDDSIPFAPVDWRAS